MLVTRAGRIFAGLSAALLLGGAAGPRLDVKILKEPGAGSTLTIDVTGVTATTVTGTPPVPRLWIEEAFAGTVSTSRPTCDERISRLAQTSALQAPVRDFNVMHIATLTATGIHVLDPRGGLRGARSLAFVDFNGRPDRWLWSQNSGRIWATLPSRQELVAVDAGSWKIARRESGIGTPIALAEGGGDTADTAAVALLSNLNGKHVVFIYAPEGSRKIELPGPALRLDSLGRDGFAVHGDKALYLIRGNDVTSRPSLLGQTRYIAGANTLFGLFDDGTPGFDDGKSAAQRIANTENVRVSRLWMAPDQKLLIAYSPEASQIHVIDVATRSVVRAIAVDRPRSIDASRSFLFIRSAGRGETLVIPRNGLLEGKSAPARWIAGGELPGANRDQLPIVATDDGLASWIDPERNQIYVYHEGMNIPTTTLRLPDANTSDLKLVGPLVRPVGKGRFTAAATLDTSGEYVAVVQSIEPRFTQCTAFKIEGRPVVQTAASRYFVKLLSAPTEVAAGQLASIRFGITAGGQALAADVAPSVGVLMMDMAGQYQERFRAIRQTDGSYLATFTPVRAGIFMVLPDPATFPGRVAGRPVATLEVKQP